MPRVGWHYENKADSSQKTWYAVNTLRANGVPLLTTGCQRFIGGRGFLEVPAVTIYNDWIKKGGQFGWEAPSIQPLEYQTCPDLPGGKYESCWQKIGEHPAYSCCGVDVMQGDYTILTDNFQYCVDELTWRPDLEELWGRFPYGWFLEMTIQGIGVVSYHGVSSSGNKSVTKNIPVQGNLNPDDPSQGVWYPPISPPAISPYSVSSIVWVHKDIKGNGPVSWNYGIGRADALREYFNSMSPDGFGYLCLRIRFVAARYEGDDTVLTPANSYNLYHECEDNTLIKPEHGFNFTPSMPLQIEVWGTNGKDITTFRVRDNNGTVDVMQLLADGDSSVTKLEDNVILYNTHTTNSDIYVCAIADKMSTDLETPEGTTRTKTFTCNDCNKQGYSIAETNLPTGATASIAKSGTQGILSVSMPLGAPHDAGYYVDVLIEGLSSSETVRVNLEITDPPYAGTVWTAKGLLANITCITQDSSTGRYYAGTDDQELYWSDDLVNWTNIPISGTFADTSGFRDITITESYIVAITKLDVVISYRNSISFAVSATFTSWAYYILYFTVKAIPGTDKVFVGGGNSRSCQHRFNIATDTIEDYSIYQESSHLNGWATDTICIDENIALFAEGASDYSMVDRTTDQANTSPTTEVLSVSVSGNAACGLAKDENTSGVYFALTHSTSSDTRDLYKSTDNGATWTKITSVTNCSQQYSKSFAWGGINALSAGGLFNKMLYSLDNGVSWAESVSTVDGWCREIFRNKDGYLVAITAGTTTNIYLSEA